MILQIYLCVYQHVHLQWHVSQQTVWIWAVTMDLGGHKVDPRDKNAILVQVSSTKKTM